ncbi:MAG: hypothetical protein HC794_10565, partial [Nitrospiraceae bacterium]|nr:hypothetical protein [Nitrospiraceae bacterium]
RAHLAAEFTGDELWLGASLPDLPASPSSAWKEVAAYAHAQRFRLQVHLPSGREDFDRFRTSHGCTPVQALAARYAPWKAPDPGDGESEEAGEKQKFRRKETGHAHQHHGARGHRAQDPSDEAKGSLEVTRNSAPPMSKPWNSIPCVGRSGLPVAIQL